MSLQVWRRHPVQQAQRQKQGNHQNQSQGQESWRIHRLLYQGRAQRLLHHQNHQQPTAVKTLQVLYQGRTPSLSCQQTHLQLIVVITHQLLYQGKAWKLLHQQSLLQLKVVSLRFLYLVLVWMLFSLNLPSQMNLPQSSLHCHLPTSLQWRPRRRNKPWNANLHHAHLLRAAAQASWTMKMKPLPWHLGRLQTRLILIRILMLEKRHHQR